LSSNPPNVQSVCGHTVTVYSDAKNAIMILQRVRALGISRGMV
jgi:CobQ-like glutamine amidotransferase family enzyme